VPNHCVCGKPATHRVRLTRTHTTTMDVAICDASEVKVGDELLGMTVERIEPYYDLPDLREELQVVRPGLGWWTK
jgi:hypothetical protein